MEELKIASSLLETARGENPGGPAEARTGVDFARMLVDTIRETNTDQKEAESQARALADGKGSTLEAVLALTKADMSLRFLVQIRNRALEAYNEIIRTQV